MRAAIFHRVEKGRENGPKTGPLDGAHLWGEGSVTALFAFCESQAVLFCFAFLVSRKNSWPAYGQVGLCIREGPEQKARDGTLRRRCNPEVGTQQAKDTGVPLRPITRGVAAEVKARMWARRWRPPWGARHGKLRILDEVPLAEMQARHCFFFNCWSRFSFVLVPKWGTVLGSRFRPRKRDRLHHFNIKT